MNLYKGGMALHISRLISTIGARVVVTKRSQTPFIRSLTSRGRSTSAMAGLDTVADPQQEALMEEECIVVDREDKILGSASKRACHLVRADGTTLLHRAFSVFAFNNAGELLLQKRSQHKVTFPHLWANTCCSHPLNHPMENTGEKGARKAAQRRLGLELGVPAEVADPDKMHFLTRVHYQANSPSISSTSEEPVWGEHEIDYILILRGLERSHLLPNPNEVAETRFLSRSDLAPFLAQHEASLTPWFSLIANTLLPVWWERLDSLSEVTNGEEIHRF